MKGVLEAILNHCESRLDTSSLRTVLYECMAIVNSRPLTVENLNDPCGPEPLTPNHLLTMKTAVWTPPPGNFEREDLYARKRWRKVQYIANQFWQRWRKEYLSNLQTRQRWIKRKRNLQVGDIVLIKEEDMIRNQWQLAKVVDTFPGKDDLVHKVRLLVADSMLTKDGKRVRKPKFVERPVHKLALILENDP